MGMKYNASEYKVSQEDYEQEPYDEGACYRALWAEVAIRAIKETKSDVKAVAKKWSNHLDMLSIYIDDKMGYFKSHDFKIVLALAGVDYSIDKIRDAITPKNLIGKV